jgi:hypothetical protein
MSGETGNAQERQPEGYQPGTLRAFVTRIKEELGDNDELIKQALADLNAQQQQGVRSHFEARMEYVRQIADLRRLALEGIKTYGMQTLRWAFLLNAGAIVVIMAYLQRAGLNHAEVVAFMKALWPFAVGCFLTALAGAAGFFNFSYSEASMPSAEALHNFLAPTARTWPIARFQRDGETPQDFLKRYAWRGGAVRNVAIVLAGGSGVFFMYGIYRVLQVAIG